MTFHSLAFEANYVCATTLIGFLAPGSEIAFLFDIFVIVLEAASHRLHVCFGNLLFKKDILSPRVLMRFNRFPAVTIDHHLTNSHIYPVFT